MDPAADAADGDRTARDLRKSDSIARTEQDGGAPDEAASDVVTIGYSAASAQQRSLHLGGDNQLTLALHDLSQGFRRVELWSMIGWHEIRTKYRRSMLGPFWLTLSMGFFVLGLGAVYSLLFRTDMSSLMPHLALGMIVWSFVSQNIIDSCTSFTKVEHLMKQIRLPLTLHVLSTTWTNIIVFFHNVAIFVLVALWFRIWPGATGLLVIPGLILVTLNAIWAGLLLATICTRFRDIPEIIKSVIQLCFFVTPIFWKPSMLPDRALFVDVNPFYHLIEVIRAPLQGEAPTLLNWAYLLVMLVVGWAVTLRFFTKFRRRIAYWL